MPATVSSSASADMSDLHVKRTTSGVMDVLRQLKSGDGLQALEDHVADGKLLMELESAEEMAVLAQMKRKGEGQAFMDMAGDTWQLACLRARKYDVDRALELCKAYMEWRQHFEVDRVTPANSPQLRTQLEAGIIRAPGSRDKMGRICVFVTPRNHDPTRWSAMETVRHAHCLLERTILDQPDTAARGIVLVVDGRRTALRNLDAQIPRELFGALATRFPLRYGGHFVVNAPWFMKVVLSVVKTFVSSKLQRRIKLLGSYEDLLRYIDADQLPREMGGLRDCCHSADVARIVALSSQNGATGTA